MKFSICIPNYNYERYLGKTIRSVLDQQGVELEILVSDNASTDKSLDVVREFNDPRIKIHVNNVNVGFSGNLDRAARMATGEYVIMLSSDDLIAPGTLEKYARLMATIARDRPAVVSSTWDVISASDEKIGRHGPDGALWLPADRAPELDELVGGPVYRVAGDILLKRCIERMKNPFNFAATCYSRVLYDKIEGYGGGRMFNPDKWFHWRMLAQTEWAYFVDLPFFCYRWHDSNQTALQRAAGALKLLVDEYANTLDLDNALLARLGLNRTDVEGAFIEYDIARHGLSTLAGGSRARARRIVDFGRAAYPQACRGNNRLRILRALLALGPLGEMLAARAYRSYQAKNGPHASA
jgi:glycosyltransferase involved in cell wall biosynthesis